MMNTHHRPSRRSRRERGSALVALIVIVIVCGALALSVLLPNISRHRAAKSAVDRERAFQLAEAGIDFGIAEMRKTGGIVPADPSAEGTPGNGTSGSFELTFARGDTNGRDDDGDGFADDSDEEDLVELISTGVYGEFRRTVRVMMRRSVSVPTIAASIQFNVEHPIVDLNGQSFYISGYEHDLDANRDDTAPPMHGVAAPTDPSNIVSQIADRNVDQIEGADGAPSVTYVDAIDLDTLVEQAKATRTHTLSPQTYSQLSLGTPDPGGVVVAVCEGDLHLSGTATGYSILVVDGDLHCSGQLLWTGIVIVRGRCDMTGGGSLKRLIGAAIVGEEVTTTGESDGTQVVRVTGTVDMLYSTEAVDLAQQRLAMMTVLSWQEVANP